MNQLFICPFLNGAVELTQERKQHIVARHPGTLPEYQDQLAETLETPDQVRRSSRSQDTLLFTKWFETLRLGRYLVVVVVQDDDAKRNWIVTAYTARRLSGGEVVWPIQE